MVHGAISGCSPFSWPAIAQGQERDSLEQAQRMPCSCPAPTHEHDRPWTRAWQKHGIGMLWSRPALATDKGRSQLLDRAGAALEHGYRLRRRPELRADRRARSDVGHVDDRSLSCAANGDVYQGLSVTTLAPAVELVGCVCKCL